MLKRMTPVAEVLTDRLVSHYRDSRIGRRVTGRDIAYGKVEVTAEALVLVMREGVDADDEQMGVKEASDQLVWELDTTWNPKDFTHHDLAEVVRRRFAQIAGFTYEPRPIVTVKIAGFTYERPVEGH
jgi:hypothetical protein